MWISFQVDANHQHVLNRGAVQSEFTFKRTSMAAKEPIVGRVEEWEPEAVGWVQLSSRKRLTWAREV